jgi:alpha-tubulin suppressor-like RCC1 family protein
MAERVTRRLAGAGPALLAAAALTAAGLAAPSAALAASAAPGPRPAANPAGCVAPTSGTGVAFCRRPVRVTLPAGTKVAALTAGGFAGYAVTRSGQVLAWGDDQFGELGDPAVNGPASSSPVLVQLPAWVRVTSVAAGPGWALALTRAGQVLGWGSNSCGQQGTGAAGGTVTAPAAVPLPAGTRVTALAAGGCFALALTASGKVLAWGQNSQGQLGLGHVNSTPQPPVRVHLPAGQKITRIAAGLVFGLAVTARGQVLAWGGNQQAELGLGRAGPHRSRPARVPLPAAIRASVARSGPGNNGYALTNAGQALSWGTNGEGQLGHPGARDPSGPVRVLVPARQKVTALRPGLGFAVAQITAGTLLAWGDNREGQLGAGRTRAKSASPLRVALPAGTKVTQLAAGEEFALVLTAAGKVLAWGANSSGEVGQPLPA